MVESESFEVTHLLSKQEADVLRKIRATITKEDGSKWSFSQILAELSAIGLQNWNKMQLMNLITPRGGGGE